MVDAFEQADEMLGGGHGRATVVQYLVTDVDGYLRARYQKEASRAAMFEAAARLAYLAGWKAHDLGREGLAQHYYAHALQLAHEADDPVPAAWVLRILAHQALDLGRPDECVALAEQACRMVNGRVSPSTEAVFTITSARAHGAAGDKRRAARSVIKAEDQLTRAEGGEPNPAWPISGPPAGTVASHTAKTWAALGDHAAAEQAHLAAVRARSPVGYRRVHALNLAAVGAQQAAQGKADEACASWQQAFEFMTGVASARHRAAILDARHHLRAFVRRGVPGAGALDHHCRQLLTPS
ncbi:hypothetical protein [Nocardioides speluncae]|uniref:hypothetical protein n=1 Tax=Nocardioides speluncae TaxID=2670337 RepID=UPI0012B17929|nr:hypothetical protein [Nocardioides speluncae]